MFSRVRQRIYIERVSYEVFARKYRPQTFDDLVGQTHVSRTLKNAVAQNRLAHAYLFVGPRGIGKTSTARILAKSLNCIHGPTVTPCGVCDNCREIAAGNSLDVIEIDGASNNSVEDVRQLRDNVRYAPAKGHYKIYFRDHRTAKSFANYSKPLPALRSPPYPCKSDCSASAIHCRKRKNHAGTSGGACDRAWRGRRSARCGIDARSACCILRGKNRRERCAQYFWIYERTNRGRSYWTNFARRNPRSPRAALRAIRKWQGHDATHLRFDRVSARSACVQGKT